MAALSGVDRIERYAELAVQVGANVQPGQLVEVLGRVEHAAVARAVARAAYRAGARYVDVLYTDQHVRRALIEHAADDVLSWTPPWLLERAKGIGAENAARRRADRRRRARPAGRPAGRPRRTSPPARAGRGEQPAGQRAAEQLDGRRRPQRGLGDADVRRARPRTALEAGRVLRAARRRRPGCGLARARDTDRRTRTAAERPAARRPALHRAGHRPDGRPAAGVALAGRRVGHRCRDPVRRQHADRGGLHHPRLAAHRGARALDPPARAVRPDRARPRGSLRGGPHRRRQGRRGCRTSFEAS